MLKFDKLILIGTSHIAAASVKEVRTVVEEQNPDIIAIELDKKRLLSMMSNRKGSISFRDIRRIGLKGWLFALIGAWAEHKLGKLVKTKPGAEMREAISLARKNNKLLALIDQDIETTLKKFSKALTWKEKWHFVVDIVKAIFVRKQVITFDLRKVPSKKVIKQLTEEVKIRYPSIHKVLVADRNLYMAKKLAKLSIARPKDKIVAVVGAGHEDEIMRLYKKYLSDN